MSRCRPQRRARNENTLGKEANQRREIAGVPLSAAENGAAVAALAVQVDAVNGREKRSRPRMSRDLVAS